MDRREFGRYLRQKRREAGFLTLESLAQVSGVTASTIYRLEIGKTKAPSIDTLKKLAGPLKVSYQELLINAGFLTRANDAETDAELTQYAQAVVDFAEPLTAEEQAQLDAFRQFLLDRRKR